MATGVYRTADALERALGGVQGGRGSGQYLNTGVVPSTISTTRRTGSADTAEAQGNQRTTGSPWAPGQIIGGPDRVLSGGGAVVDGRYIPPGINFGPSTSSRPSGGSNTGTGGGGGSSTGGGGGSINVPSMGGASTLPSQDQIDADLLAAFDKVRAEEEARINAAGSTLMSSLQGIDPMAGFKWNTANVGIPQSTMNNYFAAQGWDTGEIDTTRQLQQDLLNSFLADTGQFSSAVTQAGQNFRNAQQNVAAQLQADALRQLSLNAMAAKMGVQAGAANRKQDLANRMLELALEYSKIKANNGNLSLTGPSIDYKTITLPGGQTIQLPSTLFQ